MSHPYHHSLSSVKKWGGVPTDYLPVHSWFDESKKYYGDFRHRALRHHTLGIFEAESVFGPTITNSDGKAIPTRSIGEQHVKEDCGFVPTLQDWLSCITAQPWMFKDVVKRDKKGLPTQDVMSQTVNNSHHDYNPYAEQDIP